MAGVSNDSLAELVAAGTLLTVIYYLTSENNQSRHVFIMGLLVGVAFLTKTTVYYVSAIAGLAILIKWWQHRWTFSVAIRQIAVFLTPALLLGAIWWIHGLQTYGGTDFLGLERHDEIVIGQPRTDDYINNQLGGSQRLYWENLTETTFHSFWGQFGWMALPFQPRIYQILLVVITLLFIGTFLYAFGEKWFSNLTIPQRQSLILFSLAIVLVFAQFLIYNQTFVQFQGRYLYPALIPIALIVAIGLSGWANLLAPIQPNAKWLPVVFALGMVVFAWYALERVVILLP